jgi:hypothetical protein
MGDHYIPQHYLKGFTDDGKRLWVFDKHDRRAFATQVKSIANQTGFYSADVESRLANEVEGPGNEVLDAIRSRAEVSKSRKRVLAAYMACMLKRVPATKEWVRELTPGMIEKMVEDVGNQLDVLYQKEPERKELWKKRRFELANAPQGFIEDVAESAFLRQVMPGASPRVVAMLSRMTWQFLVFDRRPAFLACDNPVFFFRGLGIAHTQCEVSFPISSNIALWATWRADLEEGYVSTRESWVQELNRRTASSATRYLFHAVDEQCVLPLLSRSTWRINVVR